MTDLLDAVDRLTKPINRKLTFESGHRHDWQPIRTPGKWKRVDGLWTVEAGDVVDSEWYCLYCDETSTAPSQPPTFEATVDVKDDSALEQLRLLVANGTSGASEGSQQPSRRIPLDTTAFDLLERIDGRVRAWYVDLGERAKSSVPLSQVLRKWYVRFTQLPRSEDQEASYTAVLDKWWAEIRDIITPPTRQEITAPCPVCHETWVQKDDPAENSPRALWALWRETGEDSEARCLNCGTRWEGIDQMRSLNVRIDEEERLRLLRAAEDEGEAAGRQAEDPLQLVETDSLLEGLPGEPVSFA